MKKNSNNHLATIRKVCKNKTVQLKIAGYLALNEKNIHKQSFLCHLSWTHTSMFMLPHNHRKICTFARPVVYNMKKVSKDLFSLNSSNFCLLTHFSSNINNRPTAIAAKVLLTSTTSST